MPRQVRQIHFSDFLQGRVTLRWQALQALA